MTAENLLQLAATVGQTLQDCHLTLAVAESCTGGGLAQAITSIPSSSTWFDRGFVTYSNEAKQEMLGIPKTTIETFNAVSKEVAQAMAEGALLFSHADVSIATTGLAGPDGGSIEKPIGLVWFGFSSKTFDTKTVAQHFTGDRQQICTQAIIFALEHILQLLLQN